MSEPDFFQNVFAGKPPQVRKLAIDILNIYLTSPLSSRDETADDRKARLKKLVQDAVRTGEQKKPR